MPQSFGDSEEMVELYERSMMANLPTDTIHEIEAHRNMTTKNDILVAIAEAREDAAKEARAQALAEGEAKGKTEGKAEIAKAMLKENLPLSTICRITGLSEDQLRTL